jgi:hypothetical protein
LKDNEDRVNFGVDLTLVSIVPNIYLFLEAVYEGLSDEIKEYHFKVCENIIKYIKHVS